jgi:3-methylcrotonyl-CoA carboxylase alpha subunit
MRHGLEINGVIHDVFLSPVPGGFCLHADEKETLIVLEGETQGYLALAIDGEDCEVRYAIAGEEIFLHLGGRHFHLKHHEPVRRFASADATEANAAARAPMPGTVVRIAAQTGSNVAAGDAILVIESMKLETTICAWRDGIVEAVHVTEGATFERGTLLVSLVEDA